MKYQCICSYNKKEGCFISMPKFGGPNHLFETFVLRKNPCFPPPYTDTFCILPREQKRKTLFTWCLQKHDFQGHTFKMATYISQNLDYFLWMKLIFYYYNRMKKRRRPREICHVCNYDAPMNGRVDKLRKERRGRAKKGNRLRLNMTSDGWVTYVIKEPSKIKKAMEQYRVMSRWNYDLSKKEFGWKNRFCYSSRRKRRVPGAKMWRWTTGAFREMETGS